MLTFDYRLNAKNPQNRNYVTPQVKSPRVRLSCPHAAQALALCTLTIYSILAYIFHSVNKLMKEFLHKLCFLFDIEM